MIEFFVGAAIGAGGMIAKDMITGKNQPEKDSTKKQLNELLSENEKLRKRNKESERQIEELLAEVNKLRQQSKSTGDDYDDLQEELESAKDKIKKLTNQNIELTRKVKEYQTVCSSYEQEINQLKNV